MTKRINLLTPVVGLTFGANPLTVADSLADELVQRGVATYVDSQSAAVITLTGDTTLTAAHDKAVLNCTTALTITVPSGLTPMPSCIVWPPSTGNVSIARSGTATLNGAATTLTRSLASNYSGFAIVAQPTADAYGVTGA